MNLRFLGILSLYFLAFACRSDTQSEKAVSVTDFTNFSVIKSPNARLKLNNGNTLNWYPDSVHILHDFIKIRLSEPIFAHQISLKYPENIQIKLIADTGKISDFTIIINKSEKYNILSYRELPELYFQTSTQNIKVEIKIKGKKLRYTQISVKEPYAKSENMHLAFTNVKKNREEDSIIQSALFIGKHYFRFYRYKKSTQNPQDYLAFSRDFKLKNDSVFINLQVCNLIKFTNFNYTDTFILKNIKIKGGHLFKEIYTDYPDTCLINVSQLIKNIEFKIAYADSLNSFGLKLYDCASCLLRYPVALDLKNANEDFEKSGLHLKVYDCYRPQSVQFKMWKILPVTGLVADPVTGSRHNRGTAVDVSLVDAAGHELDMGSKHDEFRITGRTFYQNLPEKVKQNRLLLRKIMQKNGFIGINSEWWHFSHQKSLNYRLSNQNFNCP